MYTNLNEYISLSICFEKDGMLERSMGTKFHFKIISLIGVTSGQFILLKDIFFISLQIKKFFFLTLKASHQLEF
jgi:hypothetical protein